MFRRLVVHLSVALLALLGQAPLTASSAGDASIEIAGGGLAFAGNPSLRIEQQDVLITRDKIEVTYKLRNSADTQQAILIAFAAPDLDANAATEDEVALPSADPTNYVGSSTTVDGQPVTLGIEQRAMALGLDVTGRLQAAGLDLFPYAAGLAAKLDGLATEKRLDLLERGILRDDGANALPAWTLKTVGHWRQAFAPQQTITIVHAYRPIASALPRSDEVMAVQRQRACLTPAQERQIAELPTEGGVTATVTTVGYGATPGGDGLGPVGRFRLIVEAADTLTIVATCREGLKRTGPLQFDWSASDYTPDEDYHLLFAR
jgi:hypothetical protein